MIHHGQCLSLNLFGSFLVVEGENNLDQLKTLFDKIVLVVCFEAISSNSRVVIKGAVVIGFNALLLFHRN